MHLKKQDSPPDGFHVLKGIVDDYIENMNGINERRMALLEKDMKCLMQEARMFNLLQQNVHNIQEKYGVPQDQ